jgi:Na+/H+ antiporter NhaC
MNQNLNLNLSPAALLSAFRRYYPIAISVVTVGLVLYTGYQISQATSVAPDQAYLQTVKKKQKTVNLKANKKTLEALQQLQSAGNTTPHVNLGKNNPFSLD